ncbi:hypothetical protein [Atlantibacter hermannii]|uniref:hypothetical protein n=1 Tax=Atlantibacter hermannii TaxID=565 RepID=UPI0011CDBF56|nr:hypothetical protein [Atlantibacter hermannii]
MADWFIATEGVKVVKDSASLWPQIITAISTISAALGGVCLTHHFTRKREERAALAKVEGERMFIATELVFLLEQFAEGCAYVATDHGFQDQEGNTAPATSNPVLNYSSVSGDWRVFPTTLMYRIRELPIVQNEAERTIDAVDAYPPGFDEFFEERQYQYIRLGLKAVILARRLRHFASLPNTRLDASPWSAQNVLWKEWRQERKRRATLAILHARALAAAE